MSKFSRFMKANKIVKPNQKYAPTASLQDENGKPLEWEFKQISAKENEALRDACTIEVPVKGKPNVFRPKVKTDEYLAKMVVAATVYPDLYDKELQDSYGVMTPEDLLYALVDNAGEYQDLLNWMQSLQGFNRTLDDKVKEAKN